MTPMQTEHHHRDPHAIGAIYAAGGKDRVLEAKARRPSKAQLWRDFHALADRMAPRYRREFLSSIRRLRDQADVAALTDAFQSRDANRLLDTLLSVDGGLFDGLDAAARSTYSDAMRLAYSQLNVRDVATAWTLDMTNPRTIAFIDAYSFGLIRQITNDTREGIREIVRTAFDRGGHPYYQARQIKPLIGLTARQARTVMRREAEMMRAGLDPGRIERQIARLSDRMLRDRARNIARTETIRASSEGREATWNEAVAQGILDPEQSMRDWIVTPDDRLCPICEAIPDMNPEGVYLGQPFDTPIGPVLNTPAHPQCFTGDTRISAADGIAAQSVRWFNGDVLVFRTASGKQFSCTANHPILTPAGWIAAGLLDVGAYVISDAGRKRIPARDLYGHDVPSRMHEIAEAFGRSPQMAPAPVPVAAEDFHGDGIGSEIAIVLADRLLADGFNAAIAEHAREAALIPADAEPAALDGNGPAFQSGQWIRPAPGGLMRPRDLRGALPCGHARPFHRLGVTAPADMDPALLQDPAKRLAADADGGLQLLERLAGLVASDKIIGVRRDAFSGHVYNLETRGGWYMANGVVAHNCRCAVVLRPVLVSDRRS